MEAMVSAVTAAVDFAPVVVGIGVIAGALAVAYVASKGAGLILSRIRGN